MKDEQIRDLAGRLATPFYIYDTDVLKEVMDGFRAHLDPRVQICFAMKANPFVTGFMATLADRVEVCSYGESRIVKALGIDHSKVLISGVVKKEADLTQIVDDFGDRALYTAESPLQFDLLLKEARKRGLTLRVIPRLTNGSQFGMSAQDLEALLAADHAGLEVVGIHYFTGTQKRELDKNLEELAAAAAFMDKMNDRYGAGLKLLEYGPGFRIDYFDPAPDFFFDPADWDRLNAALDGILARYDVTFEMGRALSADCGYYATTVVDVKKTEAKSDLALVDGGIHQMHYDGQIRGMYMPRLSVVKKDPAARTDVTKKWTVCGSLCTTNDILLRRQAMQDLALGDVLVFKQTGAYSVMEGMSLFLSHELPAVYTYSQADGLRPIRLMQETYQLNMPQA
jgi:diaminopimelate decarboxylase